MGHVSQIPNYLGVKDSNWPGSLILDLHLCLTYLKNSLSWLNDNLYHFIVQFSDDSAPETSYFSMPIGSLTLWNFGDKLQSWNYQYLLHCLSGL